MKQFIKSLPKYGECFRYLCSKFPKLSEVKLKEGVFTGPDIRKLLSDSLLSETMGDKEIEALNSFKEVVHSFSRILKTLSTKPLYNVCYEAQGCKMSLKVHFLKSGVIDFIRMSVISRDYTKEDGMST
ncbi:hypothetical protein AVEN_251648-1, partial [Araneus ventricosus]